MYLYVCDFPLYDTYPLFDVRMTAPETTNTDTHISMFQVLFGNLTARLVESSREHHVAVISILVRVCHQCQLVHLTGRCELPHTSTCQELSKFCLPVCAEELVGFVNDGVTN